MDADANTDLIRRHTKTRGQGIGFAGVGIKLGLLACDEVLTETRRGTSHVATSWQLASRHRAPWHWTSPPGLAPVRGTAIRLRARNPLSPLLEATFLVLALRRHFTPLLDPAFAAVLAPRYPAGVRLLVDDTVVTAAAQPGERAPISVRLGRQRRSSAAGYLWRGDTPLPEDRRGVAVSTLGKVIKRGWDWLGLSPAAGDRVTGMVEAPALAAALTLTKGDFLRAGRPGMVYLAYRKALQEAVGAQLALWGDERATPKDRARIKRRPIERMLRSVLEDLADDFPLLGSLVDWGRGGQRRLPIGARRAAGVGLGTLVPDRPPAGVAGPASPEPLPQDRPPAVSPPSGAGPRRPTHSGLAVDYVHQPDDPALGRLVEGGDCLREGEGQSVAYRVEDTTFREPTIH